jgi:phosphatidate cytidylyltransferase
MSPAAALNSPIFLFYLALAAGLMAVAGVILGVLTWGLQKNVSHAWTAYCGWLLMVPLLLLIFFLGREAGIVFLTLVAIVGFREFARATGLDRDRMMLGTVYVGISATGAVSLMTDPADGKAGWYDLFMALPIFVITALLVIPVLRNRAREQLRLLALAVVGFVYFGWMFGHLAFLANSVYAYSYLGYLVLAVELNDVAAYVCGRWFGRHQLRGNISAQKTWEGALGALVVSLLLPWALLFTFPHFNLRDCVLAGLLVGLGGQLGDLVLSVIKRDLGVKDMGAVIPGHGGVLDRIDSLVYVAPLFFHYIRYRYGLNPLL